MLNLLISIETTMEICNNSEGEFKKQVRNPRRTSFLKKCLNYTNIIKLQHAVIVIFGFYLEANYESYVMSWNII